MSIETVKKWVTFTEAGTSKSGLTKIWHVTGKNGPEDVMDRLEKFARGKHD